MFSSVVAAQAEETNWSRRGEQANQRRASQQVTGQDATLFVGGLKWRTSTAQKHRLGFRAIEMSTKTHVAGEDRDGFRVRASRTKRSQAVLPLSSATPLSSLDNPQEDKGKAYGAPAHDITTPVRLDGIRQDRIREAAPISTFAPTSAPTRFVPSSSVRPIDHRERIASIHLGLRDTGRRPVTVAQAQEADQPDLGIDLDFLDPDKVPEATDALPSTVDQTTPATDVGDLMDELKVLPPSPEQELRPEDLIPPDQESAEMTQDEQLRSILGEPIEPSQEIPRTVDDNVIRLTPDEVPEATTVQPQDVSPTFPFEVPQAEGPTCDRIYRGRDCCEEEDNCANVIRFLRSRSIANISLDITPPYKPGESDSTSFDQSYWLNGNVDDSIEGVTDDNGLQRSLSDSPSRSWLDQNGQLLAEGQFTDFRNGEIYVQQADGTTETLRYDQLGNDELCFLSAWWNTPTECRLDDSVSYDRNWQRTTFTWTASSLCHKPLYFEDEQLERYGHSAGPFRQPILSAAHFFSNVMLLPYNMGVHPPNECIYDLGHYRPGNCAPWMVHAFPLSVRGLRYQASVIAGISGLMP